MLSNLASEINAFPQATLLKYLSIRYISMLFESHILSEILLMHCRSSGIISFLPSNVLLTTIFSFIKHWRMIRTFSFGPNQENGTGVFLQICFFILGNKVWKQDYHTVYYIYKLLCDIFCKLIPKIWNFISYLIQDTRGE